MSYSFATAGECLTLTGNPSVSHNVRALRSNDISSLTVPTTQVYMWFFILRTVDKNVRLGSGNDPIANTGTSCISFDVNVCEDFLFLRYYYVYVQVHFASLL
jgi:hypothetical protein